MKHSGAKWRRGEGLWWKKVIDVFSHVRVTSRRSSLAFDASCYDGCSDFTGIDRCSQQVARTQVSNDVTRPIRSANVRRPPQVAAACRLGTHDERTKASSCSL